MGRAFEVRLEALERELKELGESIRNACRELDQMIADGMMESAAVDEGFRWIWHLKRRREVMLNALGRGRGRTSSGADAPPSPTGEGKGTSSDPAKPGHLPNNRIRARQVTHEMEKARKREARGR